MILYFSLLVCIIGALIYAISTNPKAGELGRIMFAFGLLAFLLIVVPHLVTVVK